MGSVGALHSESGQHQHQACGRVGPEGAADWVRCGQSYELRAGDP